MNENNGKRREWVKTVAIIFLSVLLVLTFFSNTIMNYSLPEVATQYVEPGTITAKIRGTGTVKSADPYSVKLKTTTDSTATGIYEVHSVEVQKGDIVQKGDVLCQLASTENSLVEEAREELEKQLLQYEIAILQGEVSGTVLDNAQNGNTSSMSDYQSRVLAKEQEIENLKAQVKEAEETLEAWKEQADYEVDPKKEKKKLDEAQAAYDEVADVINAAKEEIAEWQAEIDSNNKIIKDYEDGMVIVDENGNQVPAVTKEQYETAKAQNAILKKRIDEKNAEIADEEAKLPELEKALKKAQKAYDNKISDTEDNVEESIEEWTKEVENRQKLVEEAEDAKAKLISDIVNELEWSDTLSEMKENIAKLQNETVGGEVVAPISGEIIAVNVRSGEDTPSDGILFTIQPEGKGYTMDFAVTNEQARRVSVGNVAELVNSWRYDDVEVLLTSIKPNPQNPSQSKLLTFDITGDVTDGQSLSVALGERSSEFELTVPNSAIREDNNGKFILIVETKSTPLSNRYIATRVDVEVLASDDTRTAISAPLYGYDYVITTSTAPVEAGNQVRLANG
ncbi:MAG: HlyD family efflux transporter periplasmic adaptor subunit [Lachnospiraceae bacterium]|nr:HlyD family efflux transporter periplasmic adaptor subunit [Lachnospiraceae bacterium]